GLQAKLLRVLQEGEFERLGGTKTQKSDVRIIAASNRNLEEEVKAKRFREDLYYRLNVITITIPPLRSRKEDIPLLVHHFVKSYASKNKKAVNGFDEKAMQWLTRHSWPGNVRELENMVERAVVLSKGNTLTQHDLPESVSETPQTEGDR